MGHVTRKRGMEMHIYLFWSKNLRDQGVGERIILNWISNK